MGRTRISDVGKKIGEKVRIFGWVEVIRDQGSIKFLLVRDVSGKVQVVVSKGNKKVFKKVESLTLESVIEIEGLVKEEKQAPGGFEIEPEKIEILSLAEPELPIPVVKKGDAGASLTKRLNWRWIDLRKPEKQKIFKVWTSFEKGAREYFDKQGYIQIYTPSLMSTASESGADVFEVKYFKKKAFLAQSPQFYKQAAMAAGLEKVFMVGPSFRAEPSFTTRHVTEYTGFDFEMSFIESHHDVMEEQEKLLVAAFKKVKEEQKLDIEIPQTPFPKITMKKAKEKLAKAGIKSSKDFDVSPEEEKELSKIIKEETGSDFLFLIDWPKEGRPFYHMRHEDNSDLTKSFDLLYKGLEVVTGSQREHRYGALVKQAKEKKIPLKSLEDYFNFFKYGCPPHGGVGMGPARIIMKMLDLPTIKEAIFLPRDVKRLTP